MAIDHVVDNEEEFELIGLDSFFNNESDNNVNWEEFFQLTDNTESTD